MFLKDFKFLFIKFKDIWDGWNVRLRIKSLLEIFKDV